MASSSSDFPIGFSTIKYFTLGATQTSFTVFDGSKVSREQITHPEPGDIWYAVPQDGNIHNIWVYGRLEGKNRKISGRQLVLEWSAVPQDVVPGSSSRVYFPTNVKIDGGRFLSWKTVSSEGLDWVSRGEVSNKSEHSRYFFVGKVRQLIAVEGKVLRAEKGTHSLGAADNLDAPQGSGSSAGLFRGTGQSDGATASSSIENFGDTGLTDAQKSLKSKLKELWDAPIIRNGPTYENGVAILQRFVQQLPNSTSIEIFDTHWIKAPTMSDLVIDLLGSRDDFQTSEVGCTTTGMKSGSTVVTSYLGVADHPSMGAPGRLSVINIPMTARGLGSCIPAFDGDVAAESTFIEPARPNKSGIKYKNPFHLEGSLIASGNISGSHLDFHGAGQFMIHFLGQKLWLFWIPSAENLRKWNAYYLKIKDFTLKDYLWAMDNLEGMRYAWLDATYDDAVGPTLPGFYVPPYTIHLVISFSVSAHGGIKVVREDWFETTKKAFEWDTIRLRNFKSSGGSLDVSTLEADAARDDVEMWRELAEKLNGEKQKLVEEFVESAHELLDVAESELRAEREEEQVTDVEGKGKGSGSVKSKKATAKPKPKAKAKAKAKTVDAAAAEEEEAEANRSGKKRRIGQVDDDDDEWKEPEVSEGKGKGKGKVTKKVKKAKK